MAQDYANKSKPRRGAVRQSPVSKAKKKKSGIAWRRLGVLFSLLLLLVGFGFGLYHLAGVKPDPKSTQQQVHQEVEKPAAKTQPKQKAVANKPAEDRYEFYDLLPKSEVVPPKIEAYQSTPRTGKNYQYLLQAGSFRNASDADKLRAELILKGMPNVVASKVESDSGSVWYRVRLGPFPTRSKLNEAQDKLVRMNLEPLEIKMEQ